MLRVILSQFRWGAGARGDDLARQWACAKKVDGAPKRRLLRWRRRRRRRLRLLKRRKRRERKKMVVAKYRWWPAPLRRAVKRRRRKGDGGLSPSGPVVGCACDTTTPYVAPPPPLSAQRRSRVVRAARAAVGPSLPSARQQVVGAERPCCGFQRPSGHAFQRNVGHNPATTRKAERVRGGPARRNELQRQGPEYRRLWPSRDGF